MSRSSPFIVGLILGTVALGAGYFAVRYSPELNGQRTGPRDRLLAEISEPEILLRRALPKQARTRSCGFGEALVRAQRQSVRPVSPGSQVEDSYDHETPESRIDAMLNATTCNRPGAPSGLDEADLADLLRSGPMLVRRTFANGERAAARAWALRVWALGQDLVANDPARFTVLGHQLQTVAIDAFAWWLAQPELTESEREEARVLAMGLLERAPDARQVVQLWAARSLRAGLQDPSALDIDGEALAAEVTEAARWWKAVAQAAVTPGGAAPLPLETKGKPAVRALLIDPQAVVFSDVNRHVLRARLAASLMYRRATSADEGCPAPWEGEPPLDPVSGLPVRWDANLCQVAMGDRTYGPDATPR